MVTRQTAIAGRLARLRVRNTAQVDEDGNPAPKRIHTASTPRRLHPTRFSRTTGTRRALNVGAHGWAAGLRVADSPTAAAASSRAPPR